jgi:serine/threonine protein kinase
MSVFEFDDLPASPSHVTSFADASNSLLHVVSSTQFETNIPLCDRDDHPYTIQSAIQDEQERESLDPDQHMIQEIVLGDYSAPLIMSPLKQMLDRTKTPQHFHFIKVIGTGSYGKVFLVQEISTGKLFAMKTLKKASIIVHIKYTEHTRAERTILQDVEHPFIVKLHYAFQTPRKLYLVLQYVGGGELFTHMARERMMNEDWTCFIAAELVLALEHLHGLGIIYRDLKPENVLLDREGHVVLTDFGLSKVALDSQKKDADGMASTICGTVEYMAPEVVMEHVRYDKAVDWWSLGVMLYDMMTGAPPFRAGNRKGIMDAILHKRVKLPGYLSPDAKDLINRLLRKHPASRLGSGTKGANAIKHHPFFKRIDWDKLYKRQVPPPFVPVTTSEDDVSNFDTSFTSMPPIAETPLSSPVSPSNDHLFKGFSYNANSFFLHGPQSP